jgi:hypothetical protein
MSPDAAVHGVPVPDALERTDAHECAHCHRPFNVHYEVELGEPLEPAPVACPHCWRMCQVPVGRSARWGKDYRADGL